jgi:NAD-dependent dihydropyrimidine dehydrogenase PreA subunit
MATATQGSSGAYAGLPRERIPWYPTIVAEHCRPTECGLACIAACPQNVYEHQADGRVMVARPLACTVGDISCSFQCPFDAIRFPSQRELRRTLKALRQELGQP